MSAVTFHLYISNIIIFVLTLIHFLFKKFCFIYFAFLYTTQPLKMTTQTKRVKVSFFEFVRKTERD